MPVSRGDRLILRDPVRTTFLSFLIGLAVPGCGGLEERKAGSVDHGKALIEQGSFEQARSEFEGILQTNPKDARARFWLAKTLERLERWPLAAAHYLTVADLDKTHIAARIRLGQLYLAGGAVDKAFRQAEDALRIERENPDALVLRGAIRAQQENTEQAIRNIQMALRQHPGHVNGIELLSFIYLEKGKKDEALSVIDEGIKRNPASIGLLLAKVDILAAGGEIDKATRQLVTIGDLEPAVVEHRIRLARFYVGQQQLGKAERALRDAVADNPDNIRAKLALVVFLLKHGSKGQAEQELVNFIETDPTADRLRFALGVVHETTEQTEKARGLYTAIIKREGLAPDGLKARAMLAKNYIREGKQEEAQLLVDDVLGKNPLHADGLIARAEIAISKRDPTRAIADLQTVLRDTPTSSQTLRLLAHAHLMNNEIALARETLEKALIAHPKNLLLQSDLVELLLKLGQIDEAIARARTIVRLMPENRAVMEALFGLYSRQGNWAAALQTAHQMKTGFPNDATGYYLAGLALQAKKRFKESAEQFDMALEKAPSAIEPLFQIVKGQVAQGDIEEAIERITAILKKDPDNYVLQNLFGELMLKQKKFTEAENAFSKAIALKPDWNLPYARLASVHIVHAIEAYQRGLAAVPNDKVLVTGLAQLHEQRGAYKEATTLNPPVLQQYPNAESAIGNAVIVLADYRTDNTSPQRASVLTGRSDSDSLSHLDNMGSAESINGGPELINGDSPADTPVRLMEETPFRASLVDSAGLGALDPPMFTNRTDSLADAFYEATGEAVVPAAIGERMVRAAFQTKSAGVFQVEKVVPIPASVTLLASALLALGIFRLRRTTA